MAGRADEGRGWGVEDHANIERLPPQGDPPAHDPRPPPPLHLPLLSRRRCRRSRTHHPQIPAPEKPKGRTIVIGAGKGSAQMARAFERAWDGPLEGVVVTRYGYAVPCGAHRDPEAAQHRCRTKRGWKVHAGCSSRSAPHQGRLSSSPSSPAVAPRCCRRHPTP